MTGEHYVFAYSLPSHSIHQSPTNLFRVLKCASFILLITVYLIHIYYISLYSYYIVIQPHCTFHFSYKILIWNAYCITWSWNPMFSLLLVTSQELQQRQLTNWLRYKQFGPFENFMKALFASLPSLPRLSFSFLYIFPNSTWA